ncbi:hypothetical protein CBL_20795 [Carabus blaptoides fortunei]
MDNTANKVKTKARQDNTKRPNQTSQAGIPVTRDRIHTRQVAVPTTAREDTHEPGSRPFHSEAAGCPARETRGKPAERPTQPDDPTTRAEVPANEADRPTQPDDPTTQTKVPTRIRIGQLNLQKARAATNNLLPNIDRAARSPLKTLYRPGGNPRTAICTQGQEATVLLLEDISTETMTIAEITVQGLRIYGISLQRGEILLCADANSKSAIWGSPTLDKRGEQFAEMLDAMDLTVMNAGNTPTFDGLRGTSFVDHVGPSLYRDNDKRNSRNRNREGRFLQQEGRREIGTKASQDLN